MIVMFGDHQPGIEDEFFDEAMGVESAKAPNEQKMCWYETPFVIWTNYDQPAEDMGRLGAIYLSSYVLKRANLSLTPYNEFLLQLSESSPIIHHLGIWGVGWNLPWLGGRGERRVRVEGTADGVTRNLVYNLQPGSGRP